MKYLILFLPWLMGYHATAQSYESTVKYQGRRQPAAILEVAYPVDVVVAAMASYLTKKMKSAETDIKGFATFRNSQMPDTGDNADLYFKVESKKDHEREITIISLLITNPKLQQVPADSLYYLNMTEARAYLDDLFLGIEEYDLDKKVNILQEEIYYAESVYANIEDDIKQDDGDKKKTDNKSEDDKKALKNKKREIDTLKNALDILKKSRR